jgi:hypothetical protein
MDFGVDWQVLWAQWIEGRRYFFRAVNGPFRGGRNWYLPARSWPGGAERQEDQPGQALRAPHDAKPRSTRPMLDTAVLAASPATPVSMRTVWRFFFLSKHPLLFPHAPDSAPPVHLDPQKPMISLPATNVRDFLNSTFQAHPTPNVHWPPFGERETESFSRAFVSKDAVAWRLGQPWL